MNNCNLTTCRYNADASAKMRKNGKNVLKFQKRCCVWRITRMEIWCMIFETIFFATIFVVHSIIDRIILHKRLKETQIAWDEYSKDMTRQERSDNFLAWCEEHKTRKGWKHCYIPCELHIKPTVFQTTINGIEYRGTKQEISEQSGVELALLESFDGLPMEIVLGPICKE